LPDSCELGSMEALTFVARSLQVWWHFELEDR